MSGKEAAPRGGADLERRLAAPRCPLGFGGAQLLLLVALVVFGLGPILWLAKSAITPTNDTISIRWRSSLTGPRGATSRGLDGVDVGRYFWNSVPSRSAPGCRRSSSRRPADSRSRCYGPGTRRITGCSCHPLRSRGRPPRSALHRDRAPAARPPPSSTATGRSGSPPARPPSTSSSSSASSTTCRARSSRRRRSTAPGRFSLFWRSSFRCRSRSSASSRSSRSSRPGRTSSGRPRAHRPEQAAALRPAAPIQAQT